MSEPTKKNKKSVFDELFGDFLPNSTDKGGNEENQQAEQPQPTPKPSLETIGVADCSVCKAEVGVLLTRRGHPFTACGKCGARTFFNSRIAIDILMQQLRKL